jgi:glycosyltransferase involved in cell wall biosynthesis
LILSAGLECRDYETMVEAVRDLPVAVRIGASSNWSRKRNRLTGTPLPAQVSVASYNYRDLRDLYAASSFVAVPLFDVDFQAGITLILEAMAMRRAVIVTRTAGQAGAVRGPLWTENMDSWPQEGPAIGESTGIYVPPADARALRAAAQYLLRNPGVARELGENGRRTVEADYRVDQFAERFAAAIQGQVQGTRELATAAG